MLAGAKAIHEKFPWIAKITEQRRAEEKRHQREIEDARLESAIALKMPDGYRLLPENVTAISGDKIYSYISNEWLELPPSFNRVIKNTFHIRPFLPKYVKIDNDYHKDQRWEVIGVADYGCGYNLKHERWRLRAKDSYVYGVGKVADDFEICVFASSCIPAV